VRPPALKEPGIYVVPFDSGFVLIELVAKDNKVYQLDWRTLEHDGELPDDGWFNPENFVAAGPLARPPKGTS